MSGDPGPFSRRRAAGTRRADGQFTLAIRAELTVETLLDTIQPYPTFSEAVFYASKALQDALN